MIGGSTQGEAAMNTAANKKLIQQVFADSASRSGTTFVDSLAEDACWTVTGQNSWSQQFKGRDAIMNVTKTGQRYDNHYCLVYRVVDGKITEIKEYLDSDLVERVLGPFPEERKLNAS
jgi:uncharacterized protein